jgi:hypothetical protein
MAAQVQTKVDTFPVVLAVSHQRVRPRFHHNREFRNVKGLVEVEQGNSGSWRAMEGEEDRILENETTWR